MENRSSEPQAPKSSWLDRAIFSTPIITLEKFIFALIIILAIFTRLYMLEPRVMSHDETSHTYFSWLFYKGQGYAHDPVTHGPLQFHLVALSYFLFGDSDTSARIPAALFSIATVAFMWYFRRYIGRVGTLIAALLLTISPFMLFYGRYVRNEAFVAFFGIVMLWAILRYLDTGMHKYLYLFTAMVVLHFCTKETSFIYAAQALLFLAVYLIYRLMRREWNENSSRYRFMAALFTSMLLLVGGFLVKEMTAVSKVTSQPLHPAFASLPSFLPLFLIALGIIAAAGAIYFAITGFGLSRIREERTFDILMLLGTLVLPQLSAFGINILGWKIPVNATEVRALNMTDLVHMAVVVIPVIAISIVLGLWWNKRQWLINAGIWYVIYIVFYTSMFTNGAGFFTGLVGSLGYWLAQQAVNRGDQPWYYYALIQIPVYEFLPAIGSIVAIVLAMFGITKSSDKYTATADQIDEPDQIDAEPRTQAASPAELADTGDEAYPIEQPSPSRVIPPTMGLFIFWSISALLAYSIAGEKMPWLTVHITLPMIVLTGWAIGYLIDTTDWKSLSQGRGWLSVGLIAVMLPAFLSVMRSSLGDNPPFAGKSLDQLAASSEFVIAFVVVLGCIAGLYLLMKDWSGQLVRRLISIVFFAFLAVLTARAAFTASYINYDNAKEYLVYAHCAPGDKLALAQITDISRRLTGGLDMTVAFDDKTTYPYWWYLRNFPNQRYYGNTPTRDLRDVPVILVGQENFGKIEPVVGQAYDKFEYIRIWWPNMDYMNLTSTRLLSAITKPAMREAIFQVWLNRDYTKYAQLTGQDMSLQNWNPSEKFRLYIRKDVIAQLWNYGSTTTSAPVQADPYEGKQISLNADKIIGTTGTEPGQFQNPRDIAIAPDGSFYVSDTGNNRIQHLNPDGTVIKVWGEFADLSKGAAPGGTFFEPWGIAVGKDGSVYVADTWNHRIQKFSADGKFINMWGYFGQADTPFAIWGPRDIAIDSNGNLFVTDTGNKRIVVYDPNGNFVTQFGSVGMEPGQFDEPVGIAIGKDGAVYIADTWNQRIQVMVKGTNGIYAPLNNWEVVAWYGQSLDNKPYLAVDDNGNLYTTDPEGYRVLHFTTEGTFVNFFGDLGSGANGFNLPTGIVADNSGGLWVADAGNGRFLHFTLPPK